MDGEAMALTQKTFPSLPRQACIIIIVIILRAVGAMFGRNPTSK